MFFFLRLILIVSTISFSKADEEYYEAPVFYHFGYQVNDVDHYHGHNYHGHMEHVDGYKTTGEFKVKLPDGRLQITTYQADDYGYRPQVTYTYDDKDVPVPPVKPHPEVHKSPEMYTPPDVHEVYSPPEKYTPPEKGYLSPKQYDDPMSGKVYIPPKEIYAPPEHYEPPLEYTPAKLKYTPPTPEYVAPNPGYDSTKPKYAPPISEYSQPKTKYAPPKPEYHPPKPDYAPPKPEYHPPKPDYAPPHPEYHEVKSKYSPPSSDYAPPAESYDLPQTAYSPMLLFTPSHGYEGSKIPVGSLPEYHYNSYEGVHHNSLERRSHLDESGYPTSMRRNQIATPEQTTDNVSEARQQEYFLVTLNGGDSNSKPIYAVLAKRNKN